MRVAAITIGNMLRQVVAPTTFEPTTQRVTALRSTLTTELGKHKAHRQIHLPRIQDRWLIGTIIIACIASIISTIYVFQHHEIVIYGDGLSHLRIAQTGI